MKHNTFVFPCDRALRGLGREILISALEKQKFQILKWQ